MARFFCLIPILFLCLPALSFAKVYIAQNTSIRSGLLKNIAPIIQQSINKGYYPGAIVLAAHKGKIIYKGVFGYRRLLPTRAPMQFDTIFDIASLTKVVATTPAIMQLVEQGKINLDAPVATYWPAFTKNGKGAITIRQLLTHTSGLPSGLNLSSKLKREAILEKVAALKLKQKPGKSFLYSDINFIVLAEVVKKISGQSIDQYAKEHIFKPLMMKDTCFLPAKNLIERIAPTEFKNKKLRWGKVHDPLAYQMDGVSGHAGLFGTANDLGKYAQSLLEGGKSSNASHFLGPLTIAKMITPQLPQSMKEARGLGFDIDSIYSTRGHLFPIQSFGHSGWTGTSLWIDPVTETWVIVLTSRAHPRPAKKNQIVQDRRTIANIISASIIDVKIAHLKNTSSGEIKRAFQ